MPELPEVETVRRSLEPALFSGRVVRVRTSGKALRGGRAADRVRLRTLVGARFVAARRHGKYLMLDTDHAQTLLVHLGMTGQLLVTDEHAPELPHTHVVVTLSSGRALRFVDPRRFGLVRLYASDEIDACAELRALGPDPLGGAFEREAFVARLGRTRRDLKSALMDQRVVAGLGNIYVSEALFVARLSPLRRADRTRPAERAALFDAIHEVLARAIANRGTSISDYVDADGRGGVHQHALLVYDRAGEPCRRCGKAIAQRTQQGRSTYYCPGCQRAPRLSR